MNECTLSKYKKKSSKIELSFSVGEKAKYFYFEKREKIELQIVEYHAYTVTNVNGRLMWK